MLRSAYSVFMYFVRMSEGRAIISSRSSNLLIFKTNAESVYRVAQNEYLNIIWVNLRPQRAKHVYNKQRNLTDKCK